MIEKKVNDRLLGNLELFDFIFVPSSLVRAKFEYEKNIKKKVTNLVYIPISIAEGLRLLGYYEFIKNCL